MRSRLLEPRVYRVPTRDGWKIALYNYAHRPYDHALDSVILCHGLTANRFNVDAPGELSLARYLHAAGWDVWVLELRGAGRASRPRLWNRKRYDWNFDDYVHHDLPAAIRFVLNRTHRDKVHWVGHSMGGMLAYAFLATHGQDWARSVVTVGSPSMRAVRHPLLDKIVPARGLLKLAGRVPVGASTRLIAPLMPLYARLLGSLFMNPANMRARDLRRLARRAVDDVPASLFYQLADWYAHGGMSGHYGFVSYTESLQRITVPLYVMAGAADKLTPAQDLAGIHDTLGSTDKRYHAFGRDTGCHHDYGHIDLILGKHAREEVWPHILAWLDEHAATSVRASRGGSVTPLRPARGRSDEA